MQCHMQVRDIATCVNVKQLARYIYCTIHNLHMDKIATQAQVQDEPASWIAAPFCCTQWPRVHD